MGSQNANVEIGIWKCGSGNTDLETGLGPVDLDKV